MRIFHRVPRGNDRIVVIASPFEGQLTPPRIPVEEPLLDWSSKKKLAEASRFKPYEESFQEEPYSHSNIDDAATPLISWMFKAGESSNTSKNPSSATQLYLAASASVSGATGTNQDSRSFTLLCW